MPQPKKYYLGKVPKVSEGKLTDASGALLDAVYQDEGVIVDKEGDSLNVALLTEVTPDNSEDPVTVNLADHSAGFVLVRDAESAATSKNISVTPVGDLVDSSGASVDQIVIDTDDGYALVFVLPGTTILLASNGADLVT